MALNSSKSIAALNLSAFAAPVLPPILPTGFNLSSFTSAIHSQTPQVQEIPIEKVKQVHDPVVASAKPKEPRPYIVPQVDTNQPVEYERNGERYKFIVDRRDKDKNRPGHPDYDPKTLYIPPITWEIFTAFERQYWGIKQHHMDKVIFFKKGKFYGILKRERD